MKRIAHPILRLRLTLFLLITLLLPGLFLLSGCHTSEPFNLRPADSPAAHETPALLKAMGGYHLPDSDFTYVDIMVPLDHTNPADERLTKVVFGVLPASGVRKGMLVIATGGPGSSGLYWADSYVPYYDTAILDCFDLVFFDQRGIGLSGDLKCPAAAAAYYRDMSEWDPSAPGREESMLRDTELFVQACIAEMGSPQILPYLGTAQAVEDLELFRSLMGDEKFWIIGESYGTQLAQTYAARYPGRLAGMVLDGPVDLTQNGIEYFTEMVTASYEVLLATFEAGDKDEACAADMGAPALEVYAGLIARLKEEPLAFNFPLPHGESAARHFTFNDLETVAGNSLYDENSRMLFLRALAYYARDGDPVMLARYLYSGNLLDPATLGPVDYPSYSDAIYYSVQAQDYSYFAGTPRERAKAYLQAGLAVEDELPYMAIWFYGDLPVPFWPGALESDLRPAPLAAANIPTLVLGSTADPATPYSNTLAVFNSLADGYLITQEGGPHVIYGRDNPCIDDLVTTFLVGDRMPAQRRITCQGSVIDDFVPLAPRRAAAFSTLLQAIASAADEIYYLPEYYYWDLVTPVSVGCPYGGTFSFAPSATGEIFTLDACSFSEGLMLTGVGAYDYDTAVFTLEVEVRGVFEGVILYKQDETGGLTVTGTINGKPVKESVPGY
ncbi:MAG: alpha/beta fold hydrolase [Dethiobacteria bacterium]|nr:alpha/beta fold hydrolase [Dethiobacteria bacterium]